MQGDIIDKITSFRGWVNTHGPELLTPLNFFYFIFSVYLIGLIIYILDNIRQVKGNKVFQRGVITFIRVLGFNFFLYACIILAVFVFPDSRFTLYLKDVLDKYPSYSWLSFYAIIAVSLISCIVGILSGLFRRR